MHEYSHRLCLLMSGFLHCSADLSDYSGVIASNESPIFGSSVSDVLPVGRVERNGNGFDKDLIFV